MPDILDYAEYRTYLKDRYQALRERDARFSHRFIAQRVGVSSAGWFADITAGRQKLKARQIPKLALAFKMEAREADFLGALVDIERAAHPEERVAAVDRWLTLKGMKREAVEADRFAFFDHWYHLALRELLGVRPFTGDYEALGSALQPPVPAARIQKALDLLQRLGLVQPQMWNRRMMDLPTLVKAPAGDARQWNKILKDLVKLSVPAVDNFRKEERNLSALTLSLSPDGLKKAGEEIATLRKRLLMVAEKDKSRNRVYQCLFQVFPLSQPLEAPRD